MRVGQRIIKDVMKQNRLILDEELWSSASGRPQQMVTQQRLIMGNCCSDEAGGQPDAGQGDYANNTPSPGASPIDLAEVVLAPTTNTGQASNGGVVIIGAGISGLAAARKLVAAGVQNVVVLESRDRIGGRLNTVTLGEGVKVDAGGAWIQGVKGNPLAALAKQHNLPTGPTQDDNTVFTEQGKKVSPGLDDEEDLMEDFLAWLEKKRGRNAFNVNTNLQQAYDKWLKEEEDGLSAAAQLKLRNVMTSGIETEYAADLNELSALYFDQDEELDDKMWLWKEGYGSLIHVLAQGLDIRTRKQVTSIDYSGASVVVKTTSGEEWTASYVICTLPLGVLKSSTGPRFIPPLPQDKQTAIQSLGVGLLNKVILRFNTAFWASAANTDWINIITNPPGQWADIVSLHRTFKLPVLVFLAAGVTARQQESLPDEAILANITARLRAMFPSTYQNPINHCITRWASDPHACGAYSFIKVGADEEAYTVLSQPVNKKLFFAGEATNQQYPATAHGAFMSGEREAHRILQAMGKK